LLKSNEFTDSFKGVTFYIAEKTKNNELNNIFIKDTNGSLNTMVSEVGNSDVSTIFAKKGYIANEKLILFDGFIQSLGEGKIIKNIFFKKTELSIDNFRNRTIKQTKIQETSSRVLFQCLKSKNEKNIRNCSFKKNNKEVTEAILRRIGMPLYIPLITIMVSFLLVRRKEKKYNYIKKYIVFSFAFVVLVFAEIFLKYTGVSLINVYLYLLTPLVLFLIFYFLLAKNSIYEKII
jgi:lipopolysaccharide export system permease protein